MKQVGLRRILAVAATMVFAVGLAASAFAANKSDNKSGSCPNAKDLRFYKVASNVAATFSNNGSITTYVFESLVDESPVNGIPGLVKYCVYPKSIPTQVDATATGADGSSWIYGLDASDFMFGRAGGNKSNIPLDGNTTVMGTATWSGAAPDEQTILLHIADSAMCSTLYGGTLSTCFVKPTLGPICDVAAANVTGAAYSSIPRDAVNCGPPSHAFEGTSTREFGDEVALASGGTLDSLTVLFNSYACQDFPLWNNSQCTTLTPGTFTWPITANIYAVGSNHTVGALLDTVQVTQTIPYRPSADTALCGTTGAWFNTVSRQCEYSAKVLLTFTFSGGVSLSAADHVIWTVAFNTSDYGAQPQRPAPCNSSAAGCPYDSLNVGTKTFDGAPYVGTDVDTHGAFIDSTWKGIYCDDGTSGTGFLRVSTNPPTPCTNTEAVNNYSPNAWLGYTPLGTIKVK